MIMKFGRHVCHKILLKVTKFQNMKNFFHWVITERTPMWWNPTPLIKIGLTNEERAVKYKRNIKETCRTNYFKPWSEHGLIRARYIATTVKLSRRYPIFQNPTYKVLIVIQFTSGKTLFWGFKPQIKIIWTTFRLKIVRACLGSFSM